eukprot:392493_1
MAEFSHVGKHCTLSSCGRHDFLPFFCNRCGSTFCNEHYKYDDHGCLEEGGCDIVAIVCPMCSKTLRMPSTADANAVWHEHAISDCDPAASRKKKKSQICAAPRCQRKLGPTITQICKRCRKKTCLTHRFPDTHDCWRSGSWGNGPQDRKPGNSPPTYIAAKQRMKQSSQLHNVKTTHQVPAPHHSRRSAKPRVMYSEAPQPLRELHRFVVLHNRLGMV